MVKCILNVDKIIPKPAPNRFISYYKIFIIKSIIFCLLTIINQAIYIIKHLNYCIFYTDLFHFLCLGKLYNTVKSKFLLFFNIRISLNKYITFNFFNL